MSDYGADAGNLTQGSVETQKDIGLTRRDEVRKWLLEINLSSKGEEKFRRSGSRVLERYRGGDRRKNSFNILWSNTETLLPAIINSAPEPDVRRRYRDADPVGKAVEQVLGRSLQFSLQTYDAFQCIRQAVVDALLPGRGVTRIRYVPSLREVGVTSRQHDEEQETDEAHEALEGTHEELDWEQVCCEHVNWQDFRRGQGRVWEEVQWVAFRHRLTREQMVERFGEEVGNAIHLKSSADSDVQNLNEKDPVKDLFATGEVWEIWDKEDRCVYFVSEGYPNDYVKVIDDDPLDQEQFFPIPRPLQFFEDTDKLEPIALFQLYESQANELDNCVFRRNKIVDALKVRGVYDATITEMSQIMRGNDNDLIPAKNVSAFIDRGGLDKMIWFMPIDVAANVLKVLDDSVDRSIQAIYEICGIGDIMRSSTDPNETATAQKLKSTWGSMRLQKMQREVQRYCRDLVRMMGNVIASRFQLETLKAMTLLQYPTDAQAQQMIMQAQMQYQQQAMMAQQHGQRVPPFQPPQIVTWEQIVKVMRSDEMRTYHIDIETDSTVADQVQRDMDGLTDVLTGITQLMQAVGPAVQAGAVPIDTVKQTVQTICRRARLGPVIEDAWDKLQQPPQQPDPNAAKAQADMQIEQMKIASQEKMHAAELQQKAQLTQLDHQARAQADTQIESIKQQAQNAQRQAELESEAKLALTKQAAEGQQKERELGIQGQLDAQKAELDRQKALEVENLRGQNAKEIEAMRLQHEAAIKEREAQMQDRQREHESAMLSQKSQHESVLKERDRDHAAALDGLKRNHEAHLKSMEPKPEPPPDIAGIVEKAIAPLREHLHKLNGKDSGPKEVIIRHVESGVQ